MLKASSRCCRDTAARYPGFDAVGWGAGGARGHVNVFEPATPSLHIASRLTDSPCSTVLCRTSTPSASPPPTARHSKPNPPVEYGSPEGQPTPSLGPTRARARLPTLWARGRHSALGSPQPAGGRHPPAPRQQAAGTPQPPDSRRQAPPCPQTAGGRHPPAPRRQAAGTPQPPDSRRQAAPRRQTALGSPQISNKALPNQPHIRHHVHTPVQIERERARTRRGGGPTRRPRVVRASLRVPHGPRATHTRARPE